MQIVKDVIIILEFEVGDQVFIKVQPMKSKFRFWTVMKFKAALYWPFYDSRACWKCSLSPRITSRVGACA